MGRGDWGVATLDWGLGGWDWDWGVHLIRGILCGAGGKPSTWLPPGKLVEHSMLASTFFSEQALRYYNYEYYYYYYYYYY